MVIIKKQIFHKLFVVINIKEVLKGIEKMPEAFQPMFYLEHINLNYKHLLKKKENKDDAQNL